MLESDRYAADVRAQQAYYHERGIHAVPAVIINDRHLIQGGQPVEVFEQALRQLGAADFSRGLIAVGDLEASVLAASNLVDLGVREVWAKALSERHATILTRLLRQDDLSGEEARSLMAGIMAGELTESQIAAALTTVAGIAPRWPWPA